MGCVYQARNKIDGKLYVGKTVSDLKTRKSAHLSVARSGKGRLFQNALRKYGAENFEWSVLFSSENKSELCVMEKEFVHLLGSKAPGGYNLSDGGESGFAGGTHSPETKAKIAAAGKGKDRVSIEGRERIAAAHRGTTHTQEARAKISAAGRGRVHSEETKRLIGEGNRGKYVSIETRAKQSISLKGKRTGCKHTAERPKWIT